MLLRKGNVNDAVKVLQRGLNNLGAMLLVDGQFGTGTEAAIADARGSFPQIDALSPPRRTALASLVYNRGAGLKDRNAATQERREMRNIRALLAAGDVDAVAAQFESMTRLWNPDRAGADSAPARRTTLWRSGFVALKLE
jgi:hypothetical protein